VAPTTKEEEKVVEARAPSWVSGCAQLEMKFLEKPKRSKRGKYRVRLVRGGCGWQRKGATDGGNAGN
jgi:hypothetical protein